MLAKAAHINWLSDSVFNSFLSLSNVLYIYVQLRFSSTRHCYLSLLIICLHRDNNLVPARKYPNAIHNWQFPSRTDIRTERETDGLGLHLNAPDKTSPRLEHRSGSFGPGDDGQHIFLHTNFVAIENDGTAYYGSLPIPKKEIGPKQAKECLRLVPKYTPCFLLVLPAPSMPWNEYYIKRPKLLSYHELACSSLIAKRFLDEAQTLELIRHNPHPNIAHFAGCVVESDRIVGLALTRYSVELGDRIIMAAPDHSTRPHAYMALLPAWSISTPLDWLITTSNRRI